MNPEQPLTVLRSPADPTVRLHIGTGDGHAIRVVPEGYGAHIAGDPSALINPTRPGNPLGAVHAAALGAAEVFKQTAQVLPARRVLHRHLRSCPVTLSSDLAAAPDLATALAVDLAQVGIGAIGTGIVLLLQALKAEGQLVAVDCQRFGSENPRNLLPRRRRRSSHGAVES